MLNDMFENLFQKVIDSYNSVLKTRDQAKEEYFKNMLNIQDYAIEKPILKPEYVRRFVRDISEVQRELGIYPAYLMCVEFKNELNRISNTIVDKSLLVLVNLSLKFIKIFEDVFGDIIHSSLLANLDEDTILNLSSPKLLRLLDVLETYNRSNKEFTCLVFVNRVLISFSISKYLQELSNYDRFAFLKASFFVGQNNDYLNFRFVKDSVKNFKTTMNDFKTGKFNTLITTAVLEEGIDIGKCNLVIRFNEPVTFREFVQSKGRARAKGSYFVLIHDHLKEIEKLIKTFDKTESYLRHKFKESKKSDFSKSVLPDGYKPEMNEEDQEEVFFSKTGSRLDLYEAAPYLLRYIVKKGNGK